MILNEKEMKKITEKANPKKGKQLQRTASAHLRMQARQTTEEL